MIDIKTPVPEGFLEEEERCGHLVSKQMKEVWAIEIDLLCELMRVCNKYNIKVFAAYGTKLGAVRHKGFIPWDDDIDLGISRKDYERLCEIAEKEFKDPYFFQSCRTDIGTEPGVVKLRNSNTTAIQKSKGKSKKYNQGIFLDIFILDNITDDKKALIRQVKKAKVYHFLYRFAGWTTTGYYSGWKGIKGLMIKIVHYVFGPLIVLTKLQRRAYEALDEECKRYSDIDTIAMGPIMRMWNKNYTMEFLRKNSFNKRDEENATMFPFEYIFIPVGDNFDKQLRAAYGDYMVFVKGQSNHGKMFFDTDKSYKEYIHRI